MKTPDTYSSPQRRAINIIWTAAEDYSFFPSFVAFLQTGEPDVYLNSIIGYVHKWYDSAILDSLFETLKHSIFRETLEGLAWLTLEDCAFQKESALRPVLAELRLEYARLFFLQEDSMSRQQWMADNSLVHALQAARCRQILGKGNGLFNPWERNLFCALSGNASWSSQEIADHILDVFQKYFHLRASSGRLSFLTRFCHCLQHHILAGKSSVRLLRTDSLPEAHSFGGTSLQSGFSPSSVKLRAGRQSHDQKYIEECFGPSIFSDDEREEITRKLCRQAHKNCRLYFAGSSLPSAPALDPLAVKFREDIMEQTRKNLTHFRSRQQFYHTCIKKMHEQIQNALLVCQQPLYIANRVGKLCPSRVWKGLYLDDSDIFVNTLSEPSADFSVDLMLDASASRMESQELIAAQGYLIARSLRLCRIPVQVFSYFSTRGYTVLRRFCSYKDFDDPSAIFGYTAAGWNRDGLALRGAGWLMKDAPFKSRLLIVLTDAAPNDDGRIPAGASKKYPAGRNYSGQAGIDDTASEVRRLRQKSINVCGILTGDDGNTKAAKEIFGSDFVRIDKMEHFSSAAGTLIWRQIRKLTGA